MNTRRRTWLAVVLFAVAMAWMEAATVLYLRTLVGRIDPYQARPLPQFSGLEQAELIREAATMLMLLAVGWLAGRTWRTRAAWWLIAFGVWDILYYVFLRVLTGWPRTLLDWDVLFLIPLPWWGPVLAPMCIAALMVVWGTLVTQGEPPDQPLRAGGRIWAITLAGVALALYVFMADALRALGRGQGADALRELLPTTFNWPLFLLALALMAAPIADVGWQLWTRRRLTPLTPRQSL
jgi:hypothetical protein